MLALRGRVLVPVVVAAVGKLGVVPIPRTFLPMCSLCFLLCVELDCAAAGAARDCDVCHDSGGCCFPTGPVAFWGVGNRRHLVTCTFFRRGACLWIRSVGSEPPHTPAGSLNVVA